MNKVTEWFPAKVKPVRPGVYEVEGVTFPFHYWTGFYWLMAADTRPEGFQGVRPADREPMPSGTYLDRNRWRGLATRPSKRGKR